MSMSNKPRPPEKETPKTRVYRALDLAYRAADRGDVATVLHWIEQASIDGFRLNSRHRRQLEHKLGRTLELP
jgi:hypothetical protein